MNKIEQLRNDTYEQAVILSDEYNKCAIIRPTGFGKTGILSRFLLNKRYKHILYLYPADVIIDSVIDFCEMHNQQLPDHVEFVSYAKIARLTDEDICEFKGVDLIIADECHRLGAANTSEGMYLLLDSLPGVKLIGATATPERMDLVDEIDKFFDNRMTSRYTLHDAISDGILQKPFYCFASYTNDDIKDIEKETKKNIRQMDEGQEAAYEQLSSSLIEIADLKRMPNVIRDTIEQCAADETKEIETDYMKFIIFFRSFELLHKREKEVKDWFKEAYPTYCVNHITITSETEEYLENVHALDSLTHKSKTIDLIFSCNMMTMGYHVNSLTGIVMYRSTESCILYAQMLGRIFNSGSRRTGIVFDLVDNIHRESMYDVLGHMPKETVERKKIYKNMLTVVVNAGVDPEVITKAYLNIIMKQQGAGEIIDEKISNLISAFGYEKLRDFCELHRTFGPDSAKYDNNILHQEDLVATGWEAKYRDLIRKTVAEPIAMRCHQAYANWKEKGGDDSELTREAIMRKVPPEFVPLTPFCKVKHVTIDMVLDAMGIN